MSVPMLAYRTRAANRPRPVDWTPPHPVLEHSRGGWLEHVAAHGDELAAAGVHTFTADIAEFQPPVTGAYPYPMLMWRVDTGYRTDRNAAANWAHIERDDHIEIAPCYVPVVGGMDVAGTVKRIRNVLGSECPPKVLPMVDMESGADFAGPGNHSRVGNQLLAELVAWAGGDAERCLGYANASDWSACWPGRPATLKRTLADYSANPTPTGFYARQYYGGMPYPVPAGYPTSCPPFGSYVDLNVIPRPITQIVDDFGLDWFSMASKADLTAAINAAVAPLKAELDAFRSDFDGFRTGHDGTAHRAETLATMGGGHTVAQARAQFKTLAEKDPAK